MPRIGIYNELFAGDLRCAVNIAGVGFARFRMRVMPRTALTTEDVICGEEDDSRAGFCSCARHVRGADGINRKSKGWVQFAVVNAMERGCVDHPVRPVLPHDARDTNAVRDVDVGVGETDSFVAEGPGQILTELTRGPQDQGLHAGTPPSTVSLSQRI